MVDSTTGPASPPAVGNGINAFAGAVTPQDVPIPVLVEGQIDPAFNKKVRSIIVQTVDCVVYLDEELYTYWRCRDSLDEKLPEGIGEVLNRVAFLESIPIQYLSKENRLSFRRLIAEGVARVLDDLSDSAAMSVLGVAERFIAARSAELARGWFLLAGLVGMATFAALAITTFVLRSEPPWPGTGWLYAASMGGVGAGLSLISRLKSIELDPAAGPALHVLESIARMAVGVVGGLLIFWMMRAKWIAAQLPADGDANAILLILCLLAGASERFVPSMVGGFDNSQLPDSIHAQLAPGTRTKA